MYQFSQDLTNKLNALNQRMLKKGEVFLLAKAIADALPLMPADEDNVKLFVLNHKRLIDEVVWSLTTYSYLGDDNLVLIEKLVCDLTLWRAAVAYNPPATFYRDDPNSVIDDISNLICVLLVKLSTTLTICLVCSVISLPPLSRTC